MDDNCSKEKYYDKTFYKFRIIPKAKSNLMSSRHNMFRITTEINKKYSKRGSPKSLSLYPHGSLTDRLDLSK